jgi:HlyD family secretion protein
MKKIIIASIIVVLIGTGAFIFLKSKNGAVKFKTTPVTSGPLRSTVTATGTMNAVTTVLVGTQVSGTLKKLYVDFNSKVKKGQIIAEIDPAILQAQVDQARANVLGAQANVEKAKATMEDSRRTKERNRQLFSENLIARSDLDTAETNYETNSALLGTARAQVAQTEAALRFAETNLRYTKIVSPVDGVVVSRSVDVGQTVAASFQTPTLFTIAQDLTKMQIDTSIDEADIGKIKVGQDVEFTVDAYPENTFHGIVDQIRIAPITVQNVVTYDVVIKVDNADLRLKPGMTANVIVVIVNKDSVLKIPNAALRFRPSEKDGVALSKGSADKAKKSPSVPPAADKTGSRPSGKGGGTSGQKGYTVWMLENDKPKQVQVTIGISDGSFTEVTSGDVKEGQEVIVESLAKNTKANNNQQQSAPRLPR